ncbi:hypothetical protein H5410_057358 [Solanum commersonii]|uniref:Uncharacterized protein n=1 Tax=Solanum commersonii TaxID=4109 RepID=A0A9J5WQC6_SOLCO|nr:hypothetical protein H5410_057358 [Solanum commersonii]
MVEKVDVRGSSFSIWSEYIEIYKNIMATTEGSHYYQDVQRNFTKQESVDRLWWKKDGKGLFRISSTYKLLNQDNQ